jgi:TonB family protein
MSIRAGSKLSWQFVRRRGMKHWTFIHYLLLSSMLASPGMAQVPDSVLASRLRHCKPHNLDTRWVTFGEIGDTSALISALKVAADTDEAMTSVSVEYKEDGSIARIHVVGARSHRAAQDLESEFRIHLSQLGTVPRHFRFAVARLNAMDHVDLLPGFLTCFPEKVSSAKALSVLSQGVQTLGQRFVTGSLEARIGIWLEASGDIRAIWIERSSSDYAFDSLALQVTQALRFLPPLVGSRAAPAYLVLPVTLRENAPRPTDRFP